MTRIFKFHLTYFKSSGKYYTDIEVDWECRTLDNQPDTPYMYDVFSKVRGLRDNGGPGALPGLSGEGWEGPILVDCEENGVPGLILPGSRER